MKKAFPYIIVFVLVVVTGILLIANKKPGKKRFIERITLRQRDKIPYGTSVARDLLPSLFPQAGIYEDLRQPGQWDSVVYSSYNQAVVLMSINMDADEEEMKRLIWFASQGNYVFIIARDFSDEAVKQFGFSFKY